MTNDLISKACNLIGSVARVALTSNNAFKSDCNMVMAGIRAGTMALSLVAAPVVFAQESLVGQAVIDGVGSLIDPGRGGQCTAWGNYGCSRDVVTLHSWSVKSAGVFQVLNSGTDCSSVRIEGLSSATIIVKAWSESYPGEQVSTDARRTVYRASSMPTNISMPLGWSVVHVASTSPLSTPANVYMTCNGAFAGSPQAIYSSTSASASTLGTTMDENYSTWGGNGSLMTMSNNQSGGDAIAGYGRNHDVASTYGLGGYFSTTLFQVLSSNGNCKNVRINSSVANNFAEVRVKGWDEKYWSYVAGSSAVSQYGFRTVNLPFVVPVASSGYTLIKVDPFDNANKSSVTATCI